MKPYGRGRRRWAPPRVLVAATLATAGALLAPASSQGFVACSYSGTQLAVYLTSEDDIGTLTRFGNQVAVLSGGVYDEGDQVLVPCQGGIPTLTGTDTITVQGSGQGFNLASIDLSNGLLAPGATPEADGTSEIEVQLNLPGKFGGVILEGTSGADVMQAGTTPAGATGLNVNAGSEPPLSADSDIDLVAGNILAVDAEEGNDTVTGQGGPGFSAPVFAAFLQGEGGPGNDLLQTGTPGGYLAGGPGRDRLIGSPHRDLLIGGSGKDTLLAGKGRDGLSSADGRRDRVRCGPGRDRARADRKDPAKGCERLQRIRIRKRRGSGPPGEPTPVFAFAISALTSK